MKNVSEFTKTQALIDEYNKLKNKVPKLEAQMEQNKKRTEAKKEKFKNSRRWLFSKISKKILEEEKIKYKEEFREVNGKI